MKRFLVAVLVGAIVLGALFALAAITTTQFANATAAQPSILFEDNFDGTAVDPAKWNTTIATSGKRWCSTTVENHHGNPGNWQDVAVEPCHDLTQAAAYGAITVAGGKASFSAGEGRAFPYIWRGPPSNPSPFPSTGDFILEVRMKYDSFQSHGNGVQTVPWGNSDPVGDNPPLGNPPVFNIWPGIGGGILINGVLPVPGDPFAFHDYRLEYVSGNYYLFIDGVLLAGPIPSDVRPDTIWVGNPVFAHWLDADWTDFTIDLVRVSRPALPVLIDVKPGSDPNCINAGSEGVIPVAILTTETFDAADVDPFTVWLEGGEVRLKGKSGNAGSLEDVDRDGDLDLVVHVIDWTLIEGQTEAVVEGQTIGGTYIRGTDSVCVVGRFE